MQIYLIGFMGAGKSSVGKILAEKLLMQFYDLDTIIEQEFDEIPLIFEEHGEDFFRILESYHLKNLIESKQSFVLSTGGGVIKNRENLEFMLSEGLVFYLQTSIDNLYDRLKHQTEHRPLLDVKELKLSIEEGLSDRESQYLDAHYVINANQSIDAVVGDIVKIVNDTFKVIE